MDATYCIGEPDMSRMFDQYLYKGSDNFDFSLSVPEPVPQESGYMATAEQSYQPPSYGEEDFEITNLGLQGGGDGPHQMGMSGYQQQSMGQQPLPHGGSGVAMSPQQQMPQPQFPPQNMYIPHISQQNMTTMGQPYDVAPPHSTTAPGWGHQGCQYGVQYSNPMIHKGPGSDNNSPKQETSEDSDDSTPLSKLVGIKRPSPEPHSEALAAPPPPMKVNKKPKVQKKKKKRDPNEPQKPVSAYALFFRDTQAAIKGQNPNASFGEVSKIVASMWDSLDVETKNVYKKKTEAAKKEYLKALAAYRASLVQKGAVDGDLYGNYAPYGAYSPYSSTTHPSYTSPNSSPSTTTPMSPLAKKSPLLSSLMADGNG